MSKAASQLFKVQGSEIGDVCQKLDQREGAIEHYRQAIKLRPGFAPAEHRLQALK
jgi:hypothetical protein